jgi:hypothetical protein
MAVEAIKNERILYYLGAGASAKALPLARSVWEKKRVEYSTNPFSSDSVLKIRGLAIELETFLDRGFIIGNNEIPLWGEIKSIREDCKQLAKKANEFGDVDTYAKFLQIMDPTGLELSRLKKLLSIYFAVKQILGEGLDSRYVPWLVSIMKEKKFPENIKILSWNYDSQIQIAARTFGENEELSYKGNNPNYTPFLICSYPDLEMTGGITRYFSMIHLNGRAGLTDLNTADKGSAFETRFLNDPKGLVEFLSSKNVESSLHFAWENTSYHKDLMDKVESLIDDVTIMVVIGYSFPFFNREVDKAVFKKLKENGKFYKIYYQDPVLDGQQLKAQFELDKDFPIVHISQTDNFHIPFEY